MKKKRRAAGVEIDGDVIGLTCFGCGAWPVRKSWLAPCPRCETDVCRVCVSGEEPCSCTTAPRRTPATEPGTDSGRPPLPVSPGWTGNG